MIAYSMLYLIKLLKEYIFKSELIKKSPASDECFLQETLTEVNLSKLTTKYNVLYQLI